jgi:hypothetical protein
MTPKFRAAFANVFKAQSFNNQDAKFSITMLFDEEARGTEEYKALRGAAKRAFADKFGADKWESSKKKDGWPLGFKNPFRDGDEKSELTGFENNVFVNSSSKFMPGLVDQNRQPIISEEGFYSGCYARATLSVYAYDAQGNKGVAFGLNNVQKLADGEAFSGRKKAEDEFGAVATESSSESSDNYDDF